MATLLLETGIDPKTRYAIGSFPPVNDSALTVILIMLIMIGRARDIARQRPPA